MYKTELSIKSVFSVQNFINIKSVPDGANGLRFTYDAVGRDAKWTQESEPWTYGWWYWSWADQSVAVASIDDISHTITLKDHPYGGLRTGKLAYVA